MLPEASALRQGSNYDRPDLAQLEGLGVEAFYKRLVNWGSLIRLNAFKPPNLFQKAPKQIIMRRNLLAKHVTLR